MTDIATPDLASGDIEHRLYEVPGEVEVPDTSTNIENELDDDEESLVEEPSQWREGHPSLAKQPAVNRAIAAGIAQGLDDGQATALAYAVVDPTAFRKNLADPTPTRVAVRGGHFEVIDAEVYIPAVVALPTNNRVLEGLVYPISGSNSYPPLVAPASGAGERTELRLAATTPAHVLDAATRAGRYVLEQQHKLASSIAAHGIVMPLTLVSLALEHSDGEPAVHLAAAVDGSSRVTNAQQLLGLTAQDVYYDFPQDPRELRRYLGRVLADAADGDRRARERLNALTAPARIITRFVPSGGANIDYAHAVRSYVGMIHLDPPTAWSKPSEFQAKGEAVLDALATAGVVTAEFARYLAGRMTLTEAGVKGLPSNLDEQAAAVLSTLLPDANKCAVDRGIKSVTALKQVPYTHRADVAADLALRGAYSLATAGGSTLTPEEVKNQRSRYLRASRLPEYRQQEWRVSGDTPEDLREKAVAELRDGGWNNRLQLAAIAQWHLTRWGVLTREAHGVTSGGDTRGPDALLGELVASKHGLRILTQAILDGRADRCPRRVDETGACTQDEDGQSEPATAAWLRNEVLPLHSAADGSVTVEGASPLVRLQQLQRTFSAEVQKLLELREVLQELTNDSDRPLIEVEGWSSSYAEALSEKLHGLAKDLGYWARVSASARAAEATAE